MRYLAPAFLCLAAPAAAQDALAITYLCDGDAVLQVAYLNPADGPSLAVVAYAGRLIPMQAGPTGSGVRYIAFDEESGYVWHSKGDEGFLAIDAGGQENVLLGNCRQTGA